MRSFIHVRIGDLIEFSHGRDDHANTKKEGRVMDVDAIHAHECVVQVSPYEPFQQVDLSKSFYKIVYAVGELAQLTSEMIRWEIEITVQGGAGGGSVERGVIKQVDRDLNCALLSFDDGHKDWRDLTMNAFKVVGHLSSTLSTSPSKAQKNTSSAAVSIDKPHTPPIHDESSVVVRAIKVPMPETDVTGFDWYTEGGHVEVCDSGGVFSEGSLLCAQRGSCLQLYNEKRQFFEIQMAIQSFKVVIHGLVSLKSVPMGQTVEIYSPMHGEFRIGVVMKAADLGKLTPIRFAAPVGIEWLDLTSQTFKLVFLVAGGAELPVRDSLKEEAPREPSAVVVVASENSNNSQQETSSINETHHDEHSPVHHDHHDKRNHEPTKQQHKNHRHHRSHALALPVLYLGQVIELLDQTTNQYIKYKVTHVRHNAEAPHQYELEAAASSSTGSGLHLAALGGSSLTKQTVIDLAHVKARVLIPSDQWGAYKPIVVGYRVDVYEKTDRSVLNGKIIECSEAADDDPGRVHVKLKDGTKRWFDVKNTKIKLKLHGEPQSAKPSGKEDTADARPPVADSTQDKDDSPAMWQTVDRPSAIPRDEGLTPAKQPLARQQSEKISRESFSMQGMPRQASTPALNFDTSVPVPISDSVSPSRVPSLDFSSLVRGRAEQQLTSQPNPPATSESLIVEGSTETQRSIESNGAETLSDLLPPMGDVWTEEPTGKGSPLSRRYVNVATGEVKFEMPQWLRKTDDSLLPGESYIMNTTTRVRFQLPGSSSNSSTSTPQSSGRAAVVMVTLPVGPLEAARVVNQMNTTTNSTTATAVDLCAQAFGS